MNVDAGGSPPTVRQVLQARSLAIVGASEDSFWSRRLMRNLRDFGFGSAHYLVHRTGRQQFGQRCFRRVQDIGEQVDLAYVLTSERHLDVIMDDLVAAGTKAAIVLASPADRGASLARRCRRGGIALLGPNGLGFVDYHTGFAPFADRISPPMPPGSIGVVSQSGALLQLIHRAAQRAAAGLSQMVSVGSEAMFDATDVLSHLVEQPEVSVLACYLEGVPDAVRFRHVAGRAHDLGKPIVVLKAGRSDAAAQAAMAHTGALTGNDRVTDEVFAELGITRVESPEQLVAVAAAFSAMAIPRGNRIAMVSTSGGVCGIAADLVAATSLEFPPLPPHLVTRLSNALPAFGLPHNPLDVTGAVVDDPELLDTCVRLMSDPDHFDALLVNIDLPSPEPGSEDDIAPRAERVAQALSATDVPTIVASTVAGDTPPMRIAALRERGIHVADGLPQAIAALDHLVRFASRPPRALVNMVPLPRRLLTSRLPLSERESLQYLEDLGVPVTQAVLTASPREAVEVAVAAGFPVVAKVQAAGLLHKSDVGGVKLGLRTPEAVRDAARQLFALPGHQVEGVLIAPQSFPLVELIAGINIDPDWGPMVMVGMGGVLAEIFDDIVIMTAPVTEDVALKKLRRLRGFPVLDGVRGRERVDLQLISRFLVSLSEAAQRLDPAVGAIDINPVFVTREQVMAGDALVFGNSVGQTHASVEEHEGMQ